MKDFHISDDLIKHLVIHRLESPMVVCLRQIVYILIRVIQRECGYLEAKRDAS